MIAIIDGVYSQFKTRFDAMYPDGIPTISSLPVRSLKRKHSGFELSDDEDEDVARQPTPSVSNVEPWMRMFDDYLESSETRCEGESLITWWAVSLKLCSEKISMLNLFPLAEA